MTDTSTPIITPPPGIYHGTSFEEYHAWDACSNSRLKQLKQSPAHLVAYLSGERVKSTKALKLGRAVHSVLLEPEKFEAEYTLGQQCSAVTGKGEQCKHAGLTETTCGWRCGMEAHNKGCEPLTDGRVVLPQADYDTCLAMQKALRQTKTGRVLLTVTPRDQALCGGHSREISILFRDRVTGVLCKVRFDILKEINGTGVGVDAKSAVDASERGFTRAAYNMGYHRQADLYLRGAKENGLDLGGFVFIAQEKESPFAPAFYEPDLAMLDMGEKENNDLLTLYAKCQQDGVWPGYPDRIIQMAPPTWAMYQTDDDVRRAAEERGDTGDTEPLFPS